MGKDPVWEPDKVELQAIVDAIQTGTPGITEADAEPVYQAYMKEQVSNRVGITMHEMLVDGIFAIRLSDDGQVAYISTGKWETMHDEGER